MKETLPGDSSPPEPASQQRAKTADPARSAARAQRPRSDRSQLDAAEAALETRAGVAHAARRPANRRILVVDDNAAIHEDFRKILTTEDDADERDARQEIHRVLFGSSDGELDEDRFEVDSALHGEEALELVQKAVRDGRPYAVAFVDVRMPPGWDGIETTDRIWQEDPDVQIVLCTAYSDYSREEMLQVLGSSDRWVVLKKPFDPIEVQQFAHALARKWDFVRQRRADVENLEQVVTQRTRQLQDSNERLRQEIENREQVESQLRRVQKLEALGRLAAGVGHEINNPLSFLIANIEFVAVELYGLRQVRPAVRLDPLIQALDEARVGADRIAKIVSDLKIFCRMKEEDSGPVELKDVLELATSMVRNEIQPRARLVVEIADIPRVQANRGRLEQVFVNLLVNAAQSLPEGRAKENEIRVVAHSPTERWVTVEVRDTGPGIPPDEIERVFDPFYTTKPVGAGTGLGLSLCHQIVTELGGEIHVDSQVGQGTGIRISLPVAVSDQQPTERAHGIGDGHRSVEALQPDDVGNTRVLVVDDDDLVARSLKRALAHFDVRVVASGREAVELCRQEDFDVVLCDVMMDDFTGKDVYEALMRIRPGLEEKILFITGGAYSARAMEFLDSVPNVFLEKPFSFRTVERLILERVAAGRNRSASADRSPAARDQETGADPG